MFLGSYLDWDDIDGGTTIIYENFDDSRYSTMFISWRKFTRRQRISTENFMNDIKERGPIVTFWSSASSTHMSSVNRRHGGVNRNTDYSFVFGLSACESNIKTTILKCVDDDFFYFL